MCFYGANQTGDVFFIISIDYKNNFNNLAWAMFNDYCYMYIFNEKGNHLFFLIL